MMMQMLRSVFRSFNEARLSELADYRKTNGHCNVPIDTQKNKKLGNVGHDPKEVPQVVPKRKKSQMTPST
jgi:hypothetical protein